MRYMIVLEYNILRSMTLCVIHIITIAIIGSSLLLLYYDTCMIRY